MSERRTVSLGTVILLVALAGYAFLAFGNGMDRLAASNPSRADLVPGILRAQAARTDAAVALSRSELRQSEAYAVEALRSAPGNSRSLGTLASAQLLRGDPWAAHRVLEVARNGGWRDPVAQAYWTRDRLARGAPEAALRHLEALLRTQPNLPVGEQLLAAAAFDPEGRIALIERLKSHEPFARELFLVDGSDLSSAVALRGDLLLDPTMETQPYGCSIAESVIEGLAERQMSDKAEAVAALHCAI